jgi:rubrerythrin
MIRLQRSMLAGLTDTAPTVKSVRASLRNAIGLEHATIPPYLYALYSLDAEKNAMIAEIIQSVVVEEMLHMTLASNVLNALGGSLKIDQPGFIPAYPGPLPGGVESDLTINLAPFSMDQLQVFLKIEQPEDPLSFPKALRADNTITIGEFYTAILKAIDALDNSAFVNPPRNQVGPTRWMPNAVVVTDKPTARAAITTIIEQGEGTSKSPREIVGTGYAHYYRFNQIKEEHLLIPIPVDPGYAYAGPTVRLDPTGVYNVAPGILPSLAGDNFNYTYTSLLRALDELFNGQNNPDQFGRAYGLMMSLKGQAKAMIAGIPNPGAPVGPSFQYQPINPMA